MSAAATSLSVTFAGFPFRSWAFAVRIWVAAVLALLVSFWLQLEVPSSAMLTVMILAEPTRGQALEKAAYRLLGTVLGVIVSIAIVGALSQTRDLLLVAFALWMGLCIYACAMLDGYRAYAAVLSGYTVAFIAIQQIDNPQHLFQAAMERGAAISVGVLSIALVDLLLAPNRHPQLGAKLNALHRRVRSYAKAVIRGETPDAAGAAGLIRDIVALRPDISALATESSSGPARSAAARNAIVALVAELHAVRRLAAVPTIENLGLRATLSTAIVQGGDNVTIGDLQGVASPEFKAALNDLRRRASDVRLALTALDGASRTPRAWRAPIFRSQRVAVESGVRAAACVAVASIVYILAGWPNASSSLSLVAVALGLGATTPAPRTFAAIGFIGAPIAVVLTAILEFCILNGVSDFPLLALGLAPFLIGAALVATLPNPLLVGLGKINLIFISAVFAANNPQTYNPQAFLFTSLFTCLATGLLLAILYLIPPVSDGQRRRWLLASAKRDLELLPLRSRPRYAAEEATFRDATRVAQVAAAGPGDLDYASSVEQALAYFDRAAAIRCSSATRR